MECPPFRSKGVENGPFQVARLGSGAGSVLGRAGPTWPPYRFWVLLPGVACEGANAPQATHPDRGLLKPASGALALRGHRGHLGPGQGRPVHRLWVARPSTSPGALPGSGGESSPGVLPHHCATATSCRSSASLTDPMLNLIHFSSFGEKDQSKK